MPPSGWEGGSWLSLFSISLRNDINSHKPRLAQCRVPGAPGSAVWYLGLGVDFSYPEPSLQQTLSPHSTKSIFTIPASLPQ